MFLLVSRVVLGIRLQISHQLVLQSAQIKNSIPWQEKACKSPGVPGWIVSSGFDICTNGDKHDSDKIEVGESLMV